MNAVDVPRSVRADKNQGLFAFVVTLGVVFILGNFFTASIIGFQWLLLPAIFTILFSVAKVIERQFPNNWLHFIVQLPILLVGSIWLIDVVLIFVYGQRLHGASLAILFLAIAYVVIINFLILRHMKTDEIVRSMIDRGLITVSKETIYFLMPDKLGADAGLPGWLYNLVRVGRVFWISACILGVIIYGTGVYSSVNATERLLNITGTLGIGFAVLISRLWLVPVFLAVQHKFERGPLPPCLLKQSQAET
ncbi:hypothetical protein Q0601_09120 [Paracoccus onubensis]|uniref:hypothetical protein n=1 Tax=Paracoccus onubensis TaxID=1675788 RepID=UPI002732250D|nr:hypothetical protein [Paracoccus onubensis]MDP0927328.1 hypothetical protein [Paracoccus onubensis]